MEFDIQTIIQGGAVGISVLLIILLGFIIKLIFTFMGNHINHNTKSNQELTGVIRELKEFLIRRNGNK